MGDVRSNICAKYSDFFIHVLKPMLVILQWVNKLFFVLFFHLLFSYGIKARNFFFLFFRFFSLCSLTSFGHTNHCTCHEFIFDKLFLTWLKDPLFFSSIFSNIYSQFFLRSHSLLHSFFTQTIRLYFFQSNSLSTINH